VAHEVPRAEVWGVDISPEAAALGKDNARHLGLGNIHFRAGDLLDALPRKLRGHIDVFTIHPPYVLRRDLKELPKEIREFEPLQSLTDGSDDGLGLVRRLAHDAHEWLKPGGKKPRADSGTVVGAMEASDRVHSEQTVAVGGVKAVPAVRALAKKLGVDLSKVNPTGAGSVATMQDVKNAAAAGTARPSTTAAAAAPAQVRASAPTPAAAAPTRTPAATPPPRSRFGLSRALIVRAGDESDKRACRAGPCRYRSSGDTRCRGASAGRRARGRG